MPVLLHRLVKFSDLVDTYCQWGGHDCPRGSHNVHVPADCLLPYKSKQTLIHPNTCTARSDNNALFGLVCVWDTISQSQTLFSPHILFHHVTCCSNRN